MKKFLTFLFILISAAGYAQEAENKLSYVEKKIDLGGIVSSGKLRESIGIETLADIVTPILVSDSAVPVSITLKLGISADCHCAKLKLFRIPANSEKKPREIAYDAIQGFDGQKTIEVRLEVTADSQLHLKVEFPADLKPGESLKWISARELKPVQTPEKK